WPCTGSSAARSRAPSAAIPRCRSRTGVPEERAADSRPVCAVFLAVFAVYAFCAYPFAAPRDSADLALAALRLGVAHPPGYPLYALLGHLWILLLPLGSAVYRLNLLSAAGGAGAC